MPRNLNTQTIKRFRGINAYELVTALSPEWAQDCLNVVVGGNGSLSKLRLPVNLTPAIGGIATGPDSFWDFQQPNGTRQIFASFGQALYYFDTNFTVSHLIETSATDVGPWSAVELQNLLYLCNGQRMLKWTGTALQNIGIAVPTTVITSALVAGAMAGTYEYAWAAKNSVTGHVSSRNPFVIVTPAGNNVQLTLDHTDPAFADPQTDFIVWYRTLLGGGILYRLCEQKKSDASVSGLNAGTITGSFSGSDLRIVDANTTDANLDQLTTASIINNPPIQGNYLANGQGRLFVFNLTNAPQDFIYSGLEQILTGNPPECFPPGNRLRLNAGAEVIAGGGVLQAGVVAFSSTGKMFIARGSLQDVVTSAPVNFTSFLEELPWTLGCLSHLSIQATPYGLVWLAGDKTVQLFDGSSKPQDISAPVYPLLRSITAGTESQCIGAYFNWLERDWYSLTCCVAGSATPNAIILWGFNSDSQDLDIFPASLSASFVGVVTTSQKQRLLCISSAGRIQSVPVTSDAQGGITRDFTIVPPTTGILPAYWVSSYFGNDQPQRSKMFRFANLIADQDPGAFAVSFRLVDNLTRTLRAPEVTAPVTPTIARVGLNKVANRVAVEIDFPGADQSVNVLELGMAHIPVGDR